ncbi:MAG: Dipeptidyl-peptidase 5 [Chlamydiia bacterium]|nr:Dipeptidyl-peptidase 5 [Chlamydiia bacterium]
MKYILKGFILTAAISQSIFANENEWKPEFAFKVNQVEEVDVSPDGKDVLYSVTKAKIENESNRYETQIWKGKVNDPSTHFQFTTDNYRSSHARWSPNGNMIAFISSRSGTSQLYLISPNGGEAFQITDLKDGVHNFHWSPDSNMLAFVTSKAIKKKEDKDKESNFCDDVSVYPSKKYTSHLYMVKALPFIQQPEEITKDEMYVLNSFDWSPDSKSIAFNYAPFSAPFGMWKHSQIAVIDIDSKEVKHLPKVAETQHLPIYSPNGDYIAFIKFEKNSEYSDIDPITIFDTRSKECFTLKDETGYEIHAYLNQLIGWTQDSSSVIVLEDKHFKNALVSIPIDGSSCTQIDDGNWLFENPLLSRNGKYLGVTLEALDKPGEGFVTSIDNFAPKQVSHVNDELKQFTMPKAELITWKSYDGTEIEGLLIYPKDYEEGNSYPLLLNVHGGPMCKFDEAYLGNYRFYPMPSFSEAGFFVLKPNPRGSSGYGKEYRQAIHGDWGGIDYQDLMAGVDHLIAKGLADEDRMGVMGWSYGGYLTGWIITQTDRFSAGSMGAGVSNALSHSLTTDGRTYMSYHFDGETWDKPENYMRRSPVRYAGQINTPLLIQHGRGDKRVPFSQSIEMYNALLVQNKPVVFAAYPRSGHAVLEPKLRKDCIQRNFDWFVKHVKNK